VAKNPAALELQKLRMEKTTPEQRKRSASKAGKASVIAKRKKRQEESNVTD
jgi:hypothetical protein